MVQRCRVKQGAVVQGATGRIIVGWSRAQGAVGRSVVYNVMHPVLGECALYVYVCMCVYSDRCVAGTGAGDNRTVLVNHPRAI